MATLQTTEIHTDLCLSEITAPRAEAQHDVPPGKGRIFAIQHGWCVSVYSDNLMHCCLCV